MDDANPSALEAGAVPVLGGVTPYVAIDGALRAVEFYKQAFDAEVAAAIPADPQGRTMHAHLYINGGSLMLSDFFPEHGHAKVAPQGFTLTLVVEDVDGWWDRAVEAGCSVTTPLAKMFWGARYGQLRDPFGVAWAINEKQA